MIISDNKYNFIRIMKELFYAIISYSIYPLIIREMTKRKATIIVYHNPNKEIFEKHIQYIAKHYNIIPLDLVIENIYRKRKYIMPKNSLAITFDDGYYENYRLCEIFKKYNIQPTIYICAEIIGTKRNFWWDHSKKNEIRSLKKMSNRHRLRTLESLYDYKREKEYDIECALTYSQIYKLKNYVDFGSHTSFHPILTKCDDFELEEEIDKAKIKIENIVGRKCYNFAYPNGEYNEKILAKVKEAGYRSGRTTNVGWNNIKTDPFQLRVLGISDNASRTKLIAQLTGLPQWLNCATKGNIYGKSKI